MAKVPIKPKVNLRSKIRWGVAGILVLLVATSSFDAPNYANKLIDTVNGAVHIGIPRLPERPFALGLDLQGGAHLIYRANVDNIAPADRGAAVEGVRDVIERRVNGLGISEPNVQTAKVGDEYQIIVELPGVTDVKQAIAMIGETPILEFKEQNSAPKQAETPAEKKAADAFNADAKKRADDLLKRLQKGEQIEALATESSEDDRSKNNGGYLGYIGKGSAYPELYSWAASVKEGIRTQATIESSDGYNLAKRGKERDGEKEVSARHILICYLGAKGCAAQLTKDEALKQAQDVYAKADAGNFADLAKQYSSDSTKDNGGDLGSFARGAMVKPFDDAVWNAVVGQIIGPVETEFGYHIIYKTGETATKKYEVWRVLVKKKSSEIAVTLDDLWQSTGLSGKQLKQASVVSDPQTGEVQVSLQFNDEGTELFSQITERNVGKPVAIFLDGEPISIPTVNQVIPNGQAVISGGFTLKDAQVLSQRLNAGALPVPVELESQQTVGATLGHDSLATSLRAGVIGALIVMLFMIFYYRLPGLLAVCALTLYISLSLAIFKLIGVTLTLSGIAGVILSVGIAVDANVLIFERMREEIRGGKSLRTAIEEGFLRAWPSIRDSNVSTLMTCVMLIWFGSSFVKGFAVTLALGILLSMFSAIVVTRLLLRLIAPWFVERGQWLFVRTPRHSESPQG